MILIKVPHSFGAWAAISIFPFVLIKSPYINNQRIIRHEAIHQSQQFELSLITLIIIFPFILMGSISLLWILLAHALFYIWYLLEWVLRASILRNFKLMGKAYYLISFEQEAYKNEHDRDYLKRRKPFAFLIFLFKSESSKKD